MSAIEAVLFDADGVLQSTPPGYVDLARAWAVTGQKRLKRLGPQEAAWSRA